jgi:uncharacterized protein YcaQ
MTLDDIRRRAVAQSLFPPTTLKRAVHRMGFVQADPIRAPARAQDLVLRHRVTNYRAGDLERRYAALDIQEDWFINYGFVTTSLQALMHPRVEDRVPAEGGGGWSDAQKKLARKVLAFVRSRGEVSPREVDEEFSQGKVTNWWGGLTNATTRLLEAMHYRGLIRVVRRDSGVRIFAAQSHGPGPTDDAARRARLDALANAAILNYAPLPGPSLHNVLRRLRYAVPQMRGEIPGVIARAKERLAHESVGGVEWYWPARTRVPDPDADPTVRLLAPFDPTVWDRDRFELLWDWVYRFEAYTPAPRRRLGYYALPLLWRDRVIGWANLAVTDGRLDVDLGYARSPPRDRVFKRELGEELARMRVFLGLEMG